MTINSRAKGARFERRIAKLIADRLGVRLERNLNQSRRSGRDLTEVDQDFPFAIECKDAAVARFPAWWRQAVAQAAGRIPVLVFKVGPRAALQWAFPAAAMSDLWLMRGRVRAVDGNDVVVFGTDDAIGYMGQSMM